MSRVENLFLGMMLVVIGLTAYELFQVCLTTQQVVYRMLQ